MADITRRHVEFLNDISAFEKDIEGLYGRAYALQKRYVEEFDSEKDHSLENCDRLEADYFFDSTDVANAVNYGLIEFINFWTEYGKFLRRIK
jgi:hypothetical protein